VYVCDGELSLRDCRVTGNVFATRDLIFGGSSCKGDVLTGAEANVLGSSAIEGDLTASHDIVVLDSTVTGSLLSREASIDISNAFIQGTLESPLGSIELRDSNCQSQSIQASKAIRIFGGALSEEASVRSSQGNVQILMYQEGETQNFPRIDRVEGKDGVSCANLSCRVALVGSPRKSIYWNRGALSFVQSGSQPKLEGTSIDKLELWHEVGTRAIATLNDSVVKEIEIKSFISDEDRELRALVTPCECCTSESSITFVGGQILGTITCPEGIELDLRSTNFDGNVVQCGE
jgi:hypothetical protein